MAAAIVAVAAIAVVSGLIQAHESAKARGANQEELNKIRESFESLVPPEYDISINDPPAYIEGKLKEANLDFSRFTPEDYKVLQQYAPQAAPYAAEANPTLVQGSALAREGRAGQTEAYREYLKAARGQSPELQIRLDQAARSSQQAAQSRTESAISDAQRRGMGGAGTTFAAQLQGNSDAMEVGAQQGQSAALASYQAKMDAMRGAGEMGRTLANDELNQEGQNANIINSFNQRTSRNYQDYMNQQAALQNEAQRLNIGQNQSAADANVTGRNKAQMYNQENQNELAMKTYGMARDERDYSNNIAEAKASWAAKEKDRQNQLRSQTYNDQLGRHQGMAGIAGMQMGMNTQNSQDKNQQTQSVANAATGAAGQYYQNQREDERWAKYGPPPRQSGAAYDPDFDEYLGSNQSRKYRG